MQREHSPFLLKNNILRGTALAVIGLSALSCGRDTPQPETIHKEAHFAVTCPPDSIPAITEVASSGAMPKRGEAMAGAVVRLACISSEGVLEKTPVAVQDTKNEGACLGYGQEYHLTVEAEETGRAPEFFLSSNSDEVAIVGLGADLAERDSTITGAQIHHHDHEQGAFSSKNPAKCPTE